MDFIFMLTRDDRTVDGCVELLGTLRQSGLRHVGCKEVGASAETLTALLRVIRAMGATSYLELVGTTFEECERGARWAIDLGFDCLLGGSDPERLARLCTGRIAYFPFPGRPTGHPTQLHGNADAIAADCARLTASGCPGVDLLLYRAVDDDPDRILTKARAACDGRLIVAGSIGSPSRIEYLARSGVDAFTIGSAILDGSIFPKSGSVADRVARVLRQADAART